MSEAGIIILPHPHDVHEGESPKDADMLEPEPVPLKWPRKPGISHSDIFDSDDSWYDTPPEGFSLTVSPLFTYCNSVVSNYCKFMLELTSFLYLLAVTICNNVDGTLCMDDFIFYCLYIWTG